MTCFGSATNCPLCKNVREGDRCVSACSLGYVGANKTCTTVCHSQCADGDRCTGPTASDCRNCRAVRLVNSTTNALRCVSSCPSTLPYFQRDRKVCIASCLPGQYPSSKAGEVGQCNKCHPECDGNCTGDGAKFCEACKAFYDNTTQSCVGNLHRRLHRR